MSKNSYARKVDLYKFEGPHRRLGRLQGEALGDVIRDAAKVLAASEELEVIKPSFIPAELYIKAGELLSWFQYSSPVKKHFPEQYRRIMGLARGAGVSPGYILLLASFEVELNKTDFQLGGCSAAGVCGTRSATGNPLIIKNFDYPAHFSQFHVTRLDAPEGRYKVLNVGAAPIPGCHEGVNEHGLCIAYNYGYGQDKQVHKIPITILCQEALETCRTTKEAVEQISSGKRSGGAILTICDDSGDLRVLELSNGMHAERLPENGVVVVANHYLDKNMAKIDVPENAHYSDTTIKAIRGCRCRESSEERHTRVDHLLGGHATIDEKTLISIFSDHGADNKPSDITICRHSDYYATTCSVILNPVKRTMKVVYDNPCSSKYKEFSAV